MSIIERYRPVANSGDKPHHQIARWARNAVADLRTRNSRGVPLTFEEVEELTDTLEDSLATILSSLS